MTHFFNSRSRHELSEVSARSAKSTIQEEPYAAAAAAAQAAIPEDSRRRAAATERQELYAMISCDLIHLLEMDVHRYQTEEAKGLAERSVLRQQMEELQAKLLDGERALSDVHKSLRETIAQETLQVHYEYEERLRQRDSMVDELQRELEAHRRQQHAVQNRKGDAAVQAGDATKLSLSEKELLTRQHDDAREHLEALLAAERSAAAAQRRHVEEVCAARASIELDAAKNAMELERSRWHIERAKLESARQEEGARANEREVKAAELEKTIERLKDEWASEREVLKRGTDSLAALRRQLEEKLEAAVAEHHRERAELQREFEKALAEQTQMFDQLAAEQDARKKQVEDELALLRSDRNRSIGDHRAEMKAVEQKLLTTQVELTKRIEQVRELEERLRCLEKGTHEAERQCTDKCRQYEEMAAQAARERHAAQTALSEVESRYNHAAEERQRHADDVIRSLEQRERDVVVAHREELKRMAMHHEDEMEALRLRLEGDHISRVGVIDVGYRESLGKLRAAETAFAEAVRDRDRIAGQKSELEERNAELQEKAAAFEAAAQRWKHRYETSYFTTASQPSHPVRQSVDVSVQTPQEASRVAPEGLSSSSSGAESANSAMKKNHLIWSLQQEVVDARREIEFLSETIHLLERQRQTGHPIGDERDHRPSDGGSKKEKQTFEAARSDVSPPLSSPELYVATAGAARHRETLSVSPPSRGNPSSSSPLRDDETAEVRALLSYLNR